MGFFFNYFILFFDGIKPALKDRRGKKTVCAVTDDGTKQGVRSLHPTYCDSAFYRHLYYDDNRGGSDDGSRSSREALDRLKLLHSSRNTVDFSEKSVESVSSSACCLITTATQGVTLKLNLVNCNRRPVDQQKKNVEK